MKWLPLNRKYRWLGYLAVLLAIIWLSQPDQPEPDNQVVEAQQQVRTTSRVDDGYLRREPQTIELAKANPFAKPAPPPPSVEDIKPAPPPPPPQPPPLPYRHFGSVVGPDGKQTVFLTHGNRLLTAQEGEILDGQYRVDKVSDEEIVFTYVPLQQVQTARATR